MRTFIEKYQNKINGVLSGFDRLVLRGTLKALSFTAGMMNFLYEIGVLLKDFGTYVERTSKKLKEASYETARRLNRPIKYLPSSYTRKELIAKGIARKDGIKDGLICVLTCVEPCMSYYIRRDPDIKKLVLEPKLRKCLHIYHYWIDDTFGFMSARIQTWFPFGIYICLNGREWLAKELDIIGMKYNRVDNCFHWLEDIGTAQSIMKKQSKFNWTPNLDFISLKLNPAFDEIFSAYPVEYYWTCHQSEWATDIMFKSKRALSDIYPQLVREGISVFCSPDVMRFLGKKMHGNFKGEVISDYKDRPEGIRVKHRMGSNSVKMYDKHGRVLRIETTINDPKPFKVFRPLEGNPGGRCDWRVMRKGICELPRRAEVSQRANERYLDALSLLNTDSPLGKITEPICRPVVWNNERFRAIKPWSKDDFELIKIINRGEYSLNGFRNRDIKKLLFPELLKNKKQNKRLSGRITRKLRLLRAHGIVYKVKNSHRYLLTKKGRIISTAIINSQNVTLEQLQKIAA